jgi:hypothetical protein
MRVAKKLLGAAPKTTAKHKIRQHAICVATRLEELGIDPITIMGLIAAGDTVSLGLQTKEEFEAKAELVEVKGTMVIVKKSGLQRAAEIIPVRDRSKCASELAQYVWPKRSSHVFSNPDGTNLSQPSAPQIIVTMPDNGRGVPKK